MRGTSQSIRKKRKVGYENSEAIQQVAQRSCKASTLGGLQTQSDEDLSNLVWIQCWDSFETKAGLETSWGPFQPEGLGDSRSTATVSVMRNNGKGFTKFMISYIWEPETRITPRSSEKQYFNSLHSATENQHAFQLCSHWEHLGARKRCFRQTLSCLQEPRFASKFAQAKSTLIKEELRNAGSKA